jgi:hypothetical protein
MRTKMDPGNYLFGGFRRNITVSVTPNRYSVTFDLPIDFSCFLFPFSKVGYPMLYRLLSRNNKYIQLFGDKPVHTYSFLGRILCSDQSEPTNYEKYSKKRPSCIISPTAILRCAHCRISARLHYAQHFVTCNMRRNVNSARCESP